MCAVKRYHRFQPIVPKTRYIMSCDRMVTIRKSLPVSTKISFCERISGKISNLPSATNYMKFTCGRKYVHGSSKAQVAAKLVSPTNIYRIVRITRSNRDRFAGDVHPLDGRNFSGNQGGTNGEGARAGTPHADKSQAASPSAIAWPDFEAEDLLPIEEVFMRVHRPLTRLAEVDRYITAIREGLT